MSRGTVAIAAGGTGGHVFPGLAVAAALQERGWRVVWIGTRGGLEARAVPEAGLEVAWLEVRGLRGKGRLAAVAAPARLLRAVAAAAAILRRQRVDVVLGMGGYVAGPAGLAARATRRPLVVHEQNARAGLTNRVLARLARRVLTGFPEALGERGRWVGNPTRARLHEVPPPAARLARREGPPRVLVLGGSQGARALNRGVPAALAEYAGQAPQVRHQAGTRTLAEAQEAYRSAGVAAEVMPFIDDMAEAYAWADLVIARAGALTVAELAAVGAASVLVPLPWAVDDHQSANAEQLRRAGAARIVPQPALEAGELAGELAGLLADRRRLQGMAEAARTVACPEAAARVAAACQEVADE